MTKDVKEFVRKCKTCQLSKHSRATKLPLEITSTSRQPFIRLNLDIVGPLPATEEGFKYLLTYQDDLTKFFGAIPMTNQDANTTAEHLEHVILRFGIPDVILTDLGGNFTSDLMARILKFLGIKKYNCSPYHPLTNSSLERTHKILKNMLRAYTNEDKSDCNKFTQFAVFAINTTINRSIGRTPFEMLYGFQLQIPSNVKKKPEPIYSYDDYLAELRYKLQMAHKLAREQVLLTKQQNKEYYDRNTKQVEYKVGEEILLINNQQKTKLHDPYKGPYTINKIISDTNVQYKRGNEDVIIHKNQIKKFIK